jgi:hemerythrin-like domain-containing protein
MMSEFVAVLRQEHRNIESLLRVLERELAIFDAGDTPDYEVVRAVIAYFKDYPDACHHPKEDMMVEKIALRDQAAAARIGDLAAEHRAEARRLRRMSEAVETVLRDEELLRETVDRIIRDFIAHERRHMAIEESLVFPAALAALATADWAELALKLADRDDPFYRIDVEPKFILLRQAILAMEEEAEAERSR